MRKLPQLVPITYRDKDILLKCFADTLVYHKENGRRVMVAMRFGGYPEQVRGMSDAMYGGIAVEAEIEQQCVIISTQKKQCRRKLSHDGVYAEAMLIANDDEKKDTQEDEKKGKENIKQRKFIFCKENDRNTLFDEIDRKISVPLIPEFKDFIIEELIKNEILIRLEVLSMPEMYSGTYTKQYAYDNQSGKYYSKMVDSEDKSTWIHKLLRKADCNVSVIHK
ncbi:MAG: hypothetical protein HFG29_10780 [Eubacterium sp.]|nr:hypothetical protein [Clostridia bacterium]MCI8957430.1 hypothetical protein [Eubacterium sp.]